MDIKQVNVVCLKTFQCPLQITHDLVVGEVSVDFRSDENFLAAIFGRPADHALRPTRTVRGSCVYKGNSKIYTASEHLHGFVFTVFVLLAERESTEADDGYFHA